jgi:hypothetical protein
LTPTIVVPCQPGNSSRDMFFSLSVLMNNMAMQAQSHKSKRLVVTILNA